MEASSTAIHNPVLSNDAGESSDCLQAIHDMSAWSHRDYPYPCI